MSLLIDRRRSISGFTLLELLIVLALIGIASGLVVASVDKLSSRIDERRWEDRTRHILLALRAQAMSSGQTVSAVVSVSPSEIRQMGNGDRAMSMKLPSNFSFELSGNVRSAMPLSSTSFTLYFFPDGAMDGLSFDLISPSGMRHRFKLAKHTGRVLEGLGDASN
jgi:prepilin-type N-terminal cleavage/methylation domain-containing protein